MNMPRFILIKLSKLNTKKNIRSNNRKATNNIKGNTFKVISLFLSKNFVGHKQAVQYVSNDEREKPTTKNILPSKAFIQILQRNQQLSI